MGSKLRLRLRQNLKTGDWRLEAGDLAALASDNKQCFDKSLKIECAKLLFSI